MKTTSTRERQHGSAFVLALIVIMLLTILGLSVSVVTETEMQLGSTEKNIDRQDYAAESGLWAQIAGLVVTNRWTRTSLAIPEDLDTGIDLPGKRLFFAVETSSAKLLARQCPAWTDCGEDLDDEEFLAYFVVTASTAKRVGAPNAWETPFKNAGEDRFAFAGAIDVLGQSAVTLGTYVSPLRPPTGVDVVGAFDNDGFKISP